MAEKILAELSVVEIEGIIKALEITGVDKAPADQLVRTQFHDTLLVNGAKRSYKNLRHLMDSQATRKRVERSDFLREHEPDVRGVIAKEQNKFLKNENEHLYDLMRSANETILKAKSSLKTENKDEAIKELNSCYEMIQLQVQRMRSQFGDSY